MSRSLVTGLVVCMFVVLLSMVLTMSLSSALPIDDENTYIDSEKRAMLLDKYLDLGKRGQLLRPEMEIDNSPGLYGKRGQLLRREMEIDNSPGLYVSPNLSKSYKRNNLTRPSRSGGMSLCLWKVCPAAPWLIDK